MNEGVNMLVLSRNLGKKIVIGEGDNQVILTVLGTQGGQVRLGFEADKSVPIHREEIYKEIKGTEK